MEPPSFGDRLKAASKIGSRRATNAKEAAQLIVDNFTEDEERDMIKEGRSGCRSILWNVDIKTNHSFMKLSTEEREYLHSTIRRAMSRRVGAGVCVEVYTHYASSRGVLFQLQFKW